MRSEALIELNEKLDLWFKLPIEELIKECEKVLHFSVIEATREECLKILIYRFVERGFI